MAGNTDAILKFWLIDYGVLENGNFITSTVKKLTLAIIFAKQTIYFIQEIV